MCRGGSEIGVWGYGNMVWGMGCDSVGGVVEQDAGIPLHQPKKCLPQVLVMFGLLVGTVFCMWRAKKTQVLNIISLSRNDQQQSSCNHHAPTCMTALLPTKQATDMPEAQAAGKKTHMNKFETAVLYEQQQHSPLQPLNQYP